jgi:serine phosphatase RsbU (regulator of sigma subunit)
MKLEGDEIILGRNPDCGVVVPSNSVSRQHARILRQNGQYFIEDLNSRNFTYVNNNKVEPPGRIALKENDRIKICDFLYTFHLDISPKNPLPVEMIGTKAPALVEEVDSAGMSTLEASVGRVPQQQLLETQPSDKLRALLDIATTLGKTLSSDELFNQIADILFQVFRQADRCFIVLLDEQSGQLVPKVIKGRRANTETTARFSKTIIRSCLEKLESILSEDASSDQNIGMSQSIAEFRIRSVMCVPMATQDGRALGVIQLDSQDRTKKFVRDDLNLLIAVANQATIALENTRLHETSLQNERKQRDIAAARQVQLSFLPREAPQVEGYTFYHRYEAAQEVGGDYYDFIPLSNGKLAVLLGDVSGKGIPASLMMAKLSADARASMLTESDLALAVDKLNLQIYLTGLSDKFVTLAATVLDPVNHTVTVVNAGHMSPPIYRKTTRKLEDTISEAQSGLPLGITDALPYESATFTLEPGDSIVLYTDGVTEAYNAQEEQFEETVGVRKAVEGSLETSPLDPLQIGDRIYKAVKQHAAGYKQSDDIAIVCYGRVDPRMSEQVTISDTEHDGDELTNSPTGLLTRPLSPSQNE